MSEKLTLLSKIQERTSSAISSREECSAFLAKSVACLQSHLWLLFLGITSELIYVFFLLHDFPLTSYFQDLADMGEINEYSHTGFLKFLLFFSILFMLFGFAWWEARRCEDRAVLWIILGFGAMFAVTNILVYPATAIDIFTYLGYGLMLVQYHANPMITGPAQFAQDPLMTHLAGPFNAVPSPYGPLAQLIQALPIVIAGRNVLLSLILTKFMFSSAMLISAFIIYKILYSLGHKFALASALALAWNPFALFEYAANGHNDVAMMFLVILAVFVLRKEHHVWALVLITASALIKFATLPLIPLFFLYSFSHQPSLWKSLRYAVGAVGASLVVVLVSFAPFWAGPKTLTHFFNTVQDSLYSLSLFLQDFSAGSISPDQAKMIGLALFAVCFLFALWLSTRDFSALLKGCLLTLFALLAFGTTYLQVWYLIWPFMLAMLIPQIEVSLAAIVLLYGAILVEVVHAYIFPWGGIQNPTFAIVNSTVYLAIFLLPLLFLVVFQCRLIFLRPLSSAGKPEVGDSQSLQG